VIDTKIYIMKYVHRISARRCYYLVTHKGIFNDINSMRRKLIFCLLLCAAKEIINCSLEREISRQNLFL